MNEKGWITTYGGHQVACPKIRREQVDLTDIARSLSMQVRYLGHLARFYSVAEHSVLVSRLADCAGEPPVVVRAAFLHDAHEAYVGDFPSPFKVEVPDLARFEDEVQAEVRAAFGLTELPAVWATVKSYDRIALHAEAAELFVRQPSWVDPLLVARVPKGLWVRGLDWQTAEVEFRIRARELDVALFPG